MANADKSSKKAQARLISASGEISDFLLDESLFAVTPNTDLIAQYVRIYSHNNRQGTASTKDRSQIIGTTKKMYKQKGTGNARHASYKAPIFVGGGVVGGPKPKDYYLKISKKQKSLAFKSALSLRAESDSIYIFDKEVSQIEPKTKNIKKILDKAGLKNKSIAIVLDSSDSNILKASGNLTGVSPSHVSELNTFEILRPKALLFSEAAYSKLLSLHK